MKTVTLSLVLTALVLSACQKRYRCTCYDNANNGNVVYNAKVNAMDETTAAAECYNRQADLSTPPNYNSIDCRLRQ